MDWLSVLGLEGVLTTERVLEITHRRIGILQFERESEDTLDD